MATTRITRTIARFAIPFRLAALDEDMAAGEYRIEHEWEAIGGGSQFGYRRTGSVIFIPSISTASSISQMVVISADELMDAVEAEQPVSIRPGFDEKGAHTTK